MDLTSARSLSKEGNSTGNGPLDEAGAFLHSLTVAGFGSIAGLGGDCVVNVMLQFPISSNVRTYRLATVVTAFHLVSKFDLFNFI